jgi:hypothetical protein
MQLTEGQTTKSAEFGATHVFVTKDMIKLPKYSVPSMIFALFLNPFG